MPIQKHPKKREPSWKEWDKLAQKEGIRHAVYDVSGDVYTGEWKNNKKHGKLILRPHKLSCGHTYIVGKGTQEWKSRGSTYDGDWFEGMRHGFGTYSVRVDDSYAKEYAGGWKNDKKHVSTRDHYTWIISFLQGYGTNFYSPKKYYEGEWYAGKRSGWGRMYYADGSTYEGEWFDDKQSGKGILKLGQV